MRSEDLGLEDLWRETPGHPGIRIAVVDGPVDRAHPAFSGAEFSEVDGLIAPGVGQGAALAHGTHVASVIFGRPDGPVRGIASGCHGLLVPVFGDGPDGEIAPCSQIDLARAIALAVEAGANVINISGGQPSASGAAHPLLAHAIRHADEAGSLIVAAARGRPWTQIPSSVFPVLAVGAAEDDVESDAAPAGRPPGDVVLAPATDIVGARPGGGVATATGTSFAAAIVSGVAGLLLSLQRQHGAEPDSRAVRDALLDAGSGDAGAGARPPAGAAAQLDVARAHARIAGILAAVHAAEAMPDFPPAIGAPAPDFELPDTTGRIVALRDLRGSHAVVWFYPAASTPGCTAEAIAFRDRLADLQDRRVRIVGISRDEPAANAAFAERLGLPFPLLSDLDGAVCRAYGACGDHPRARARRMTFVIDAEGRIARILEDVDPAEHAEAVLAHLAAEEGARMDAPAQEAEPRLTPAASQAGGHRPAEPPFRMGASGHPLVFALGSLGYDLVSEPRRDSLMQHMDGEPSDPRALLEHLERDPTQAAAVTWTLNLDATPIYAIEPSGAFAAQAFERLRDFLRAQVSEDAERLSLPGVVRGQTRLMSGHVVPVVEPELRAMYSWSTGELARAAAGEPPPESAGEEERRRYEERVEAVGNFLERVYHELRNLGITSQERAVNYAATNALNVARVFEAALRDEMELDGLGAEPSPICRPDSDCWDVRLTFFSPRRLLEQARRVHRFTVDVSDVAPVMVGPPRAWWTR